VIALLLGTLAVALALVVFLWANLRFAGPAMARWNGRLFNLLQALFLATFLMDWAYGSILLSPFGIVLMGFVSPLVPFALAGAMLAWHAQRPGRYYALALLNAAQAACLVPLVLHLEQKIMVSFLAAGTVTAAVASTVSLFVLVGFLIQDIPPLDSWAGRFVFLRRDRAYLALPRLSARLGLAYRPPRSILELGEARGAYGGGQLRIDTTPRLWPLRYRMRVAYLAPSLDPARPVSLPAGWTFHVAPGERGATWLSIREMPFEEADLEGIIAELTATDAPQPQEA
jgi:hypothetical protein